MISYNLQKATSPAMKPVLTNITLNHEPGDIVRETAQAVNRNRCHSKVSSQICQCNKKSWYCFCLGTTVHLVAFVESQLHFRVVHQSACNAVKTAVFTVECCIRSMLAVTTALSQLQMRNASLLRPLQSLQGLGGYHGSAPVDRIKNDHSYTQTAMEINNTTCTLNSEKKLSNSISKQLLSASFGQLKFYIHTPAAFIMVKTLNLNKLPIHFNKTLYNKRQKHKKLIYTLRSFARNVQIIKHNSQTIYAYPIFS